LRHGKLLFVIKEAVYKVHRPLGGAFLEFHDVLVSLDDADRFVAEVVNVRKRGAAGAFIRGRALRGASWFTAVACASATSRARANGTMTDG
jgi:4'-phosphopantetheinyl transferase EntD